MKECKYLSIDEQINLLASKGLNFKSKSNARKILSEIGYYNLINAYKQPFTKKAYNNKSLFLDTTFENIYDLYKFDQDLKALVFRYTLTIETVIKSKINEVLSKQYGENNLEYINFSNFKENRENEFEDFKRHFESEIDRQIRNENPSFIWYRKKICKYTILGCFKCNVFG